MKFSQKIGKTPIREIIQIESIDSRLENRLWNLILSVFNNLSDYSSSYSASHKVNTCIYIWSEFFNNKIDEIPTIGIHNKISPSRVLDYIKKWYVNSEWYEKYDLVEFFITIGYSDDFVKKCNEVLQIEMSAFRIVNDKIAQFTSEEEINEIEQATVNTSKWTSVNTHLNSALAYLSNRENPDYRNSIKESISSIESFCAIITGNKQSTLGSALNEIEKNYKLHGALKNAFSSLYGYTSDSGGIRHKLLEDDIEVKFEDAKFMLVSCSAFINYLKVKTSN